MIPSIYKCIYKVQILAFSKWFQAYTNAYTKFQAYTNGSKHTQMHIQSSKHIQMLQIAWLLDDTHNTLDWLQDYQKLKLLF